MNTNYKSIVYRIYPNKTQEKQIQKTFGCCRFVYNKMIDVCQERYNKGEKFFTKYDMSNYLTQVLKKEYLYLREVDKFAIVNSVHALHKAYVNFFNKTKKFPKYKKKRCYQQSYKTNQSGVNIKVGDNFVQLPKLGKVKARIHRKPDEGWKLTYVYVSQMSNGEYQASVAFLLPENETKSVEVTYDTTIGLDFKMNGLYVDSNGDCADMPQYHKKSLESLKKRQRKLNHKQVGSNNYQKQQRRVSKIHRHIANQRKDFQQKASTSIAKKYTLVCVETLDLIELSHNKYNNGKSLMDTGYSYFLRMLEYKLRENGGYLQYVDHYYPSSQLCNSCGYQNKKLRDLSVRSWVCPVCGVHHDRDVNASINIKNEGYRLFMASSQVA